MIDPVALASLESCFSQSASFYGKLVACFNALAAHRYDDAGLKALVTSSMQAHGLAETMPLADVLDAIEPIHTKLIVYEADLLTTSSEQAQRRMRLLMRSPRAVFGFSEIGEDDLFAPFAQGVADEITNLHTVYVPYAHQTAENFLKAAASYPTGPSLKPAINTLENRRGRVAQEYVKLQDGMMLGAMSIGQYQAFYRGYTDMGPEPQRDYAQNTLDLLETHIAIAETNLSRLSLRITQAYLVLANEEGQRALAADPALKADFDTKFQETANGFKRVALHLDGGEATDGPLFSARHYHAKAKTYSVG